MGKHILLTGGTGFIGSNLADFLLKQNKKLILLKRSFSDNKNIIEFENNHNLTLFDLDKTNLKEIFNLYDVEGIIHLATFSQRKHESSKIAQMIDTNIKFPTELLENAINSNVNFFINTGSFFEYSYENSPISEKSKTKPFNLYSSSKIAFEDILKFYNENYDLNALTLKLFTPYGPKDDENKIIPYIIINSLKKNNILIKSSSKELDFVYITDIINSYIKSIENINKLKGYESFNIGSGKSTSILDILNIVEKYTGKNQNVKLEKTEKDKIWCSNKKAFNLLNWSPEINIKKGLKLTIDFYKNKYLKNNN